MPPTGAHPARRRASRLAADHGPSGGPIIIGHRGASGYVPEHTLASYFIAIQQGADYIEPDLVMTRDGVLVARHENEIGGTTDVSRRREFAGRRTAKVVDGVEVEGWFTEDFTLAELKTLRARERIPELRPGNARFDAQFEIPTFEEILSLVNMVNLQRQAAARRLRARASRPRRGTRANEAPLPRPVGIYPETKHPTYFDRLGLSMDTPLLRSLARHGWRSASAPVFIQSFETRNLRRLRRRTRLPLVQLIEASGAPFDCVAAGEGRTYADLVTPEGLADVATYADAIGPNKALVIPRDAHDRLAAPTSLVADAHAVGLRVHAWTFRAENAFLPEECRRSTRPADHGDLNGELQAFLATGIDGVFTDHPDIGAAAVAAFRRGP